MDSGLYAHHTYEYGIIGIMNINIHNVVGKLEKQHGGRERARSEGTALWWLVLVVFLVLSLFAFLGYGALLFNSVEEAEALTSDEFAVEESGPTLDANELLRVYQTLNARETRYLEAQEVPPALVDPRE